VHLGTTSGARCSPTCPTTKWPNISPIYAPTNIYQCSDCDSLCQTCNGYGNNSCLTCVPTAYQQGVTTCSLVSNATNLADGRPYGPNPCYPPYYGIYTTMKCQPCPTGCSMCNINITA
jgi:hypothetical protein